MQVSTDIVTFRGAIPPLLNIILMCVLGAMWIRRSFGNDPLYHTVVQAYIDTLLQQGFNFECFIEGGRSRTGKLLSPKFGILNFIVESVLSGRVKDTIICPVSTQYDKVIETEYELCSQFILVPY